MYEVNWHYVTTSPIYDPTDFKYLMKTYGVSPSSLLDDSISIVYENKTTALGLTTQLYTARGCQAQGMRGNDYVVDLDPATDLVLT